MIKYCNIITQTIKVSIFLDIIFINMSGINSIFSSLESPNKRCREEAAKSALKDIENSKFTPSQSEKIWVGLFNSNIKSALIQGKIAFSVIEKKCIGLFKNSLSKTSIFLSLIKELQKTWTSIPKNSLVLINAIEKITKVFIENDPNNEFIEAIEEAIKNPLKNN